MLPPALSNGLCSLKPQEDRLAVLAEIPFSPTGQPGKARFAPAVMRSAARLTYDQVKACLLDHDAEALARLRENPRGGDVLAMLEEAFRLYTVLREARRERGSLDFDLPEPEYTFDAEGRVLKIGFHQRHDAHRLIEEFMIAANEAVARHLRDAGLPFLYRVHPQPEPERLESLFETLAATALETMPADKQSGKQADGRPDAAAIQGILAAAQGTDQEFLVNRLCLRAMPQARYQPENEGHFGLASQAYCHFTSPIRRYADLLVHRALKTSLGQAVGPLPAGQKLLRISDQLNRRERAAVDCEREMARRLGCLALRDREGERFAGVVSGVTDFGLFVELGGHARGRHDPRGRPGRRLVRAGFPQPVPAGPAFRPVLASGPASGRASGRGAHGPPGNPAHAPGTAPRKPGRARTPQCGRTDAKRGPPGATC